MFTRYFNMKEEPFKERVTIEQILKDERLTQGLARLQFLAEFGTIALITGQTGIGKSTLIKLFLSTIALNQYKPIYIHFTQIRTSCFFNLIVTELKEVPKRNKEQLFFQIMEKISNSSLTTLLVIDEAHLLTVESLTDLRLLVSSALENKPPVKIILTGQDELKNKLKRGALNDFAQRISVYYHLKPLSKAQTTAYIDFHMNYSGASDRIFESEVKDMIHECSNGIPRQINNIAASCLINAAINKSQKINMLIFNQTLSEIQLF